MKKKSINQRLQDVIDRLGWTQSQLAESIGVDKTVVNRWFCGKAHPSRKSLRKVCDATGCDYQWLAYGYDPSPDPLSQTTQGNGGTGDAESEINIVEALDWARAVLESDTPYRIALYHNLRAFFQAVEKEEKMRRMESLMAQMLNEIKQLRMEVSELKQQHGDEKREAKVA